MNRFNNSILLTSLIKMWPWMLIFFIGFIIGISLCGIWLGVNPNIGIMSLDMARINNATFWEMGGILAAKLVKILLIAVICLLIPANKYGIIAGKIVILLISAYLGIIWALLIKSASNDYSSIIYLIALELSALWCLSIGTLKINLMKKSKLALLPVSLAAIVSLGQTFF